jgi:hypothetical protein
MSTDLLMYGIGLVLAVIAALAWLDGAAKGKW